MRDYEVDQFGLISGQGRHSKYLGVSKQINGEWTASINWCKPGGQNSSVSILCSDEMTAAVVATMMYMSKDFCNRMWSKLPTKIINTTNPINHKSNSTVTIDYRGGAFIAERRVGEFVTSAFDYSDVISALVLTEGHSNEYIKNLISKLQQKGVRGMTSDELEFLKMARNYLAI